MKGKILQRARIQDFKFFYYFKSEPTNIFWSGHSKEPDEKLLFSWFKDTLDKGKKEIWMYWVDENPVGYAYVEKHEDCFETSVGVSDQFSGQGYGSEILSRIVEQICSRKLDLPIHAWIIPKNSVSIRIHEKAGYVVTNETRSTPFGDGLAHLTKYTFNGLDEGRNGE